MNIFRIKINPGGGTDDLSATFGYCLKQGLLGVGWRLDKSITSITDWEEYENKAKAIREYGNFPKVRYIKNNVKEGDLVWTRGTGGYLGHYYLARVQQEWTYWNPPEASNHDIDVANIFRCDIREIEIDHVPGKVVSSFSRSGHTIQKIHDAYTLEHSKHTWNKISGKSVYEVDNSNLPTIFEMLSPEQAEDVLFMYLQHEGWYVIPNSRKGNTAKFEYYLIHSKTGERAEAQVKIGDTPLNPKKYETHTGSRKKVFLFQANEHYGNEDGEVENVVCISQEEIRRFLKKSSKFLPGWLQTKIEIVGLK